MSPTMDTYFYLVVECVHSIMGYCWHKTHWSCLFVTTYFFNNHYQQALSTYWKPPTHYITPSPIYQVLCNVVLKCRHIQTPCLYIMHDNEWPAYKNELHTHICCTMENSLNHWTILQWIPQRERKLKQHKHPYHTSNASTKPNIYFAALIVFRLLKKNNADPSGYWPNKQQVSFCRINLQVVMNKITANKQYYDKIVHIGMFLRYCVCYKRFWNTCWA